VDIVRSSAPLVIARLTPHLTASLVAPSVTTAAQAQVTARVSAPGLSEVTGDLTVTAGRFTASGALDASTGTVTLPALPAGTYEVKVAYEGSAAVAPTSLVIGTLSVTPATVVANPPDAAPRDPGQQGIQTDAAPRDQGQQANSPGVAPQDQGQQGVQTGATPMVSAVKTTKATIYVAKGATVKVPVVARADVAGQAEFTWTTSNAGVAARPAVAGAKLARSGSFQAGVGANSNTVLEVKAKKTGTSKITIVAASGKRLVLTVKVTAKATALKAIKSSGAAKRTLKAGQAAQLSVALSPAKATGAIVRWKTSNGAVAGVDQAGRVTAAKAGKATITATAQGKKTSFTITVK
jgi:hypothetical protein